MGIYTDGKCEEGTHFIHSSPLTQFLLRVIILLSRIKMCIQTQPSLPVLPPVCVNIFHTSHGLNPSCGDRANPSGESADYKDPQNTQSTIRRGLCLLYV
ncbi:hypothetical protein ATANTOWER_001640 [Ataeniobius toweri]|uniref:Uncharacterized protein n=1 Tax=Ataeniobius toweri TaxID=208326 RepID=A0ABU7B6L6_9TELE|nr:hypothetical protein [Ataeniobius toweri]